jgi:ankyrin repeat protein
MKIVLYLLILIGLSSAHAGSYDDFFRAVMSDNPRTIRQLAERGFDPNTRDERGQPGIIRALHADSSSAALALAQLPATNVDDRNQAGETALMVAALKGEMEVFEALLARGAAADHEGWTPLHYAASGASMPALRRLLARGVRVDPRAPNGRTPLMMAVLFADEEVIDALLAAGADRSLRDRNEQSAADLATAIDKPWLLRRLAVAR